MGADTRRQHADHRVRGREGLHAGLLLSVLVMSPRVATPPPEAGELDLGKPASSWGTSPFRWRTLTSRSTSTCRSNKPSTGPARRVRVRIHAGPRERETREPIEVAVAVLDEAVLDLIQGGTSYFDPYEGFYSQDGLDVRNFSLLTRLVGRQKIDLKGANPGGDGGTALSMRSVFKYVSYWNPSLELDARGNGEFEFEVPDNSRAGACSCSRRRRPIGIGLGQDEFKVNLPTEVRPVMPNQVTEGDRFDAAFSVMNRTDKARDIRVDDRRRRRRGAPVEARADRASRSPTRARRCKYPSGRARVALDRIGGSGKSTFGVTARDRSTATACGTRCREQAPLARDGRELRLVRHRARDGILAVSRAHPSRRGRRRRRAVARASSATSTAPSATCAITRTTAGSSGSRKA